MCFSASMSLFSLTVGLAGAIMVYSLGAFPDQIFGICYGFVSLMQGIDYLLWNHPICDDYNRAVSIAGMVLNHLQPLVLGGAILTLNTGLPEINRWVIAFLLVLYVVVMGRYSWEFLTTKEKECTLKDRSTHLFWQWNYMKHFQYAYGSYLLTMGGLWYVGLPLLMQWRPRTGTVHVHTKEPQLSVPHIWPTYGFICAFKSMVLFLTTRLFYGTEHVGGLWCFYSVFVPLIYYALRKSVLTMD
jgi:hypothetical protein